MRQAVRSAGAGISISATTTTANGAIGTVGSNKVLVLNSGSVVTLVSFGGSAVTATAADIPLGPNESRIVAIGGATHAAAITATGTATVYVKPVTDC